MRYFFTLALLCLCACASAPPAPTSPEVSAAPALTCEEYKSPTVTFHLAPDEVVLGLKSFKGVKDVSYVVADERIVGVLADYLAFFAQETDLATLMDAERLAVTVTPCGTGAHRGDIIRYIYVELREA